ncbi:MAG: SGNH/GDSL hydrolase family protein [Bryobacteraceae bacterium]
MRLACAVAVGMTLVLAAAPAKPAPKKTTAKRRAPKPPPISAKARADAAEAVAAMIDRAVDLPIENPAALVPFFEQVHRRAGLLRILHYGDSHTAADDWTGALRELLQGQFGSGGAGFSHAANPYRGYRRKHDNSAATRGWKSSGLLSREGDGLYGMGGVSIATGRAGESIALAAHCRRLEIFYWQQPGGGDLAFSDNGELVETFSTSGEPGPGYIEYETEPGEHRFELKTTKRAPVRLFGWVAENDAGVTYESLGINGAQASLAFRWDEALLASHIARRGPALIVLAYGTNETTNPNWTEESYREMFGALLGRFRAAAPAASLLVVGPPDRLVRLRGRWNTPERLDRIVAAQRDATLAAGGAFWDLRAKMGGAGVMRQWMIAGLAQRDFVHFTPPGYRRLGYLLYRDLMYNYEKYSQIRQEIAPQQTVHEPPGTNR